MPPPPGCAMDRPALNEGTKVGKEFRTGDCRASKNVCVYLVCVISTPGVMAIFTGYEHPGLAVPSLPSAHVLRGVDASYFKEEKERTPGLLHAWEAFGGWGKGLQPDCSSPTAPTCPHNSCLSFATAVLASLWPGSGPQCPFGYFNR